MLRIVMFSLAAIIMVAQSASAFDGLNMNMGTLSLHLRCQDALDKP